MHKPSGIFISVPTHKMKKKMSLKLRVVTEYMNGKKITTTELSGVVRIIQITIGIYKLLKSL